MAVIGKIRKHSGLLIVIIGVALAAFVLGDFSKTKSQRPNTIGEVNGEKLSYTEFSTLVEQNIEYQKQQQRKQSLTPSESFYVREQTWNQFVNETLLGEEFDKLGLSISKEELAELLYGNNVHYLVRQNFTDPQTGDFNPERVLNFLTRELNQLDRAGRQQYYKFEQAIKLDQINTKFSNLIKKGYYIPESLVEKMAQNNTHTASVKLLAKDISSVSDDSISYTETELKDYYKEHIEEYQIEDEIRAVDYVVFDVTPSLSDRTETTEVVNELYQEFITADDPITFLNSVSDHRYDSSFYSETDLPIQILQQIENKPIGSFVEPYLDSEVFYMAKLMDKQFRPDSLLASHVLIAYQGAQRSNAIRTKVEANQLADSLLQVLTKTSSKLPLIARQFSDDPTAKSNAGDLGWFADGNMITEFNNAVLDAAVGEILLVETAFGFHIIEVNGKKNIQAKYRIAIIDRAIEASSETYQNYWTMASKFAAENTDHNSFTKAVSDLGLNKRTFTNMTKLTSNIYDLEYPRQLVRWSFNDESEVGSISPIFDFNGKYLISIITDIEEEGARSFEKVKDLVAAKVTEKKKIDYIKNEISETNTFEQVAQKWNITAENIDVNFNLAVLGSRGREPKVVGKIFGMQKDDLETIVGNSGVYVVKFVEMKLPESTSDLGRLKTQLISSFTNKIYQNAVVDALKGVAEIEDSRHLFY